MDSVLVSDVGPVRVLSINRPDRANALNSEVIDNLAQKVSDAPRSIGAIVLTGEGRHFSAGGDAETVLAAIRSEKTAAMMRNFHQVIRSLRSCEVPVIAATFGGSVGGGFSLALACDLVIASADSTFTLNFLTKGIAPDLGGCYLLARSVGYHRAMELMLSARPIGAGEAQGLGIVHQVHPTRSEALAQAISYGRRISEFESEAIKQSLELMRGSRDLDLDSALELEAKIQSDLLRRPSAEAGFSSILTRSH